MQTALVIRHKPYEAIAAFRAPIEARGYAVIEIDVLDPDYGAIDFVEPDLLVLMGGPMAVYEMDRHPWMGREIVRVAQRIALDRPTLGVCLGAQVMAAAMGARVYPGPVREIGFSPLELSPEGRRSPLSALADVPVLHWHGDSFDLPVGATLLGSTHLYANQAFSRGPHVLGLQCHPEMGDDPGFGSWIEEGADYLAGAGVDPVQLAADYAALGPQTAAAGREMLTAWLAALDV